MEECVGEKIPQPEICDHQDNDCNGLTDDGLKYYVGEICGLVDGSIVTGVDLDVGECLHGLIECTEENGQRCAGYLGPQEEVCDGLDNNCDGSVDNDITDYMGITCPDYNCAPQPPVCREGALTCLNSGDLGEEVCDGFDNDCDGLVDEDTPEDPLFDDYVVYEADLATLNVGECRAGLRQCVHGETIISGMVLPAQEMCDLLDNDCDGSVDEDDTGGVMITRQGYAGPANTEGVGICTPSYLVCSAGEYGEIPQVLPRPEDCLNGIDDDCDGLTDEDDGVVAPQSFVLVVDVSGSMTPYRSSLVDAVCDWANTGELNGSKIAIIYSGLINPHAYTSVGMDFGTPEEACEFLSRGSPSSGGTEHMVEGALMAHTHPLSWTDGMNKQIIIFTDEQPQYSGLGWQDIQDIINIASADCSANNYQLSVFARQTYGMLSGWQEWLTIATACNGFRAELSTNFEDMYDRLVEAFLGNCY